MEKVSWYSDKKTRLYLYFLLSVHLLLCAGYLPYSFFREVADTTQLKFLYYGLQLLALLPPFLMFGGAIDALRLGSRRRAYTFYTIHGVLALVFAFPVLYFEVYNGDPTYLWLSLFAGFFNVFVQLVLTLLFLMLCQLFISFARKKECENLDKFPKENDLRNKIFDGNTFVSYPSNQQVKYTSTNLPLLDNGRFFDWGNIGTRCLVCVVGASFLYKALIRVVEVIDLYLSSGYLSEREQGTIFFDFAFLILTIPLCYAVARLAQKKFSLNRN